MKNKLNYRTIKSDDKCIHKVTLHPGQQLKLDSYNQRKAIGTCDLCDQDIGFNLYLYDTVHDEPLEKLCCVSYKDLDKLNSKK